MRKSAYVPDVIRMHNVTAQIGIRRVVHVHAILAMMDLVVSHPRAEFRVGGIHVNAATAIGDEVVLNGRLAALDGYSGGGPCNGTVLEN